MKISNTIIREIWMYLTIGDLIKSRLYALNKSFYYNIFIDNELLRRMLIKYYGIMNDYQNEIEYQISLDQLYQNITSQDSNMEEYKFSQFYDKTPAELIKLFIKSPRKFDKKQLVWGYRTTGGYEASKDQLIRVFTQDRGNYHSGALEFLGTNIVCVTGIACEENF